jgi:hypothetical protein
MTEALRHSRGGCALRREARDRSRREVGAGQALMAHQSAPGQIGTCLSYRVPEGPLTGSPFKKAFAGAQ